MNPIATVIHLIYIPRQMFCHGLSMLLEQQLITRLSFNQLASEVIHMKAITLPSENVVETQVIAVVTKTWIGDKASVRGCSLQILIKIVLNVNISEGVFPFLCNSWT